MADKQNENSRKATVTTFSSKRRLLKGAVVAPLLVTVASKPVLAGICTPSAWVSGNLSDHNKERECGGHSPGYWKTKPGQWPGPYKPGTCKAVSKHEYKGDGTRFHDIFAGGQYGDDR